jgi:hypothetical protein
MYWAIIPPSCSQHRHSGRAKQRFAQGPADQSIPNVILSVSEGSLCEALDGEAGAR